MKVIAYRPTNTNIEIGEITLLSVEQYRAAKKTSLSFLSVGGCGPLAVVTTTPCTSAAAPATAAATTFTATVFAFVPLCES